MHNRPNRGRQGVRTWALLPIVCATMGAALMGIAADPGSADDAGTAAVTNAAAVSKPADPQTGVVETYTSALERELLNEKPEQLVEEAHRLGNAVRGAVVYFQPHLGCVACHEKQGEKPRIGPDLSQPDPDLAKSGGAFHDLYDVYLVESVLRPSKSIRKGFQTVTVVTTAGRVLTGLLVENSDDRLIIQPAEQLQKPVTVPREDVEEIKLVAQSLMPNGLVRSLRSRQEFLDLLRYLMEIARGGPERAKQLRPSLTLFATRELPEYEKNLDHAGLIRDVTPERLERGRKIYERVCQNCHGTVDRPGSLPTALRFAEGRFRNGSDPYSMYRTLTYGYGMMVPQTWMVPQQKYDVIHYIRETFLRQHNPSQYTPIDGEYLAALPKGTSRGPDPPRFEPWSGMDYGPMLMTTIEVGRDGENIAYKGIAVRLDAGPGGVARGRYWVLYDHDTMRLAGAWSGTGFIDWAGIAFDGRHQVHPHAVGTVHFTTPNLPGWAKPGSDSFADPRLRGRDGKAYGPLPRDWVRFRGVYRYGDRVLIASTIGTTRVLEMPGVVVSPKAPLFTRTYHLGPREKSLLLRVARHGAPETQLEILQRANAGPVGVAQLAAPAASPKTLPPDTAVEFDGDTHLDVAQSGDFDLTGKDYSITARIRTRRGGTVFSKAAKTGPWVPDAKALFVRGGRLVFDIGWVGAVTSRRRIADGRWHNVGMTWNHRTGEVLLFVDGQLDGKGRLKPKRPAADHTVRIGFAAPDFPRNDSYFHGEIAEVRFYQRRLSADEMRVDLKQPPADDPSLIARWEPTSPPTTDRLVKDLTGRGHDATLRHSGRQRLPGPLIAGVSDAVPGMRWRSNDQGDLLLEIPAGPDEATFTLWTARVETPADGDALIQSFDPNGLSMDLTSLTEGGPAQWTQTLQTRLLRGEESGPFAVDTLVHPQENPWLCRMRFTGLDFLPGGRLAVCSWDGDVWLVEGLESSDGVLTWRRIASGLFQPLGLKVIDGAIYVGCRDQIVVLRDLNSDGETDFYECFNTDHQVTEHFHEFAMGLQTDAQGRLYYAKAGRHALKAVVPQHGTLLRVAADGSKTDIIATGFRAPNGVCVNDDGTFFLTDQEGHWIPKNRINWIREGKFYGYMWGYTDVTDESDSAMEPPVCWITNRMDRSPAELLWVESPSWGALDGALLNLSYGEGRVFVVPHERVGEHMHGAVCALPIEPFPTGIMRGRFRDQDGHLYVCGMFAWAGNRQQPGGLYRIRATGRPMHVPIGWHVGRKTLELRFTDPFDPATAGDPSHYAVRAWSLRRSARYGSEHINERPWQVSRVDVGDDGRTLVLHIPELEPTHCLEIIAELRTAGGEPVTRTIHGTIHAVP